MRQGSWIGGELVDFRAEGDTIPMLVYRINFANPAADRFSRAGAVAGAQDQGGAGCGVQGACDRRVHRHARARAGAFGAAGQHGDRRLDRPADGPALRLRTLLGLRDSLFSFDIERNAGGGVVGMTFFGRGWGHGVGMCQVGAFGMALDGATYEEILKRYYKGIELKKLY